MSREEQFKQWAKAAYRKMHDLYGYIDTDSESVYVDILAQAGYDLAQHTIGHSLEYLHECGHPFSGAMNGRIQQAIPDMPTLPEDR